MNQRKYGALFLVSTLALAGVGMSYAGFTDTLNIFGTVQTATVEFQIEEYSGTWAWKVWDCPSAPDNEIEVTRDPDFDPTIEYPGCSAQLISWAEASEGAGDYDIEFEFSNLFPCIDFVADFVFTVGTIPVKVNNISIGPITGLDWMQQLIDDGDIYATMWDEQDNPVEVGTQIHPDEMIHVEVHIHIPQHNDYQGKSGTGQATLGIIQWTDDCGSTVPEKFVNLPEGIIHTIPTTPGYVGPSYWDHTISGIGPEGTGDDDGPYNIWDGTWVGWCVSEETYIVPGQDYTIQLMSSYDPANPWDGNYPYSWPCVNYIINNKPVDATWQQIQNAIWYFIDGGYTGDDQVVLDIIEDAETNGQFFTPEEGQWVAVLCIPDPAFQHGYTVQKTFVEVDP